MARQRRRRPREREGREPRERQTDKTLDLAVTPDFQMKEVAREKGNSDKTGHGQD